LRLSLFKANSPACSLTSDTLRTALTIAGFKDELLESLVAELKTVWMLMGIWSRTDVLEATIKCIDAAMAANPLQLAVAVSYLALIGQFFDYGGSFEEDVPSLTELGAFVDLNRIPQGYSNPNGVPSPRSSSASSSS
jgi:hypothetical protein